MPFVGVGAVVAKSGHDVVIQVCSTNLFLNNYDFMLYFNEKVY